MPNRKGDPNAQDQEFWNKVNQRLAKGEDIESALDAVEQEEEDARRRAIITRKNELRLVLRRYHDILRNHGFVRTGSEGGRYIYTDEISPGCKISLDLGRAEWSYSSNVPSVVPASGKGPSLLEKKLSLYSRKKAIPLGPSASGAVGK